jgi:hypothetical protein
MRITLIRALVPLSAALFACSGDGGALSEDLKKDLEASASTIELAGQPDTYQPMRFVSELEQGKTAEPVERSRTPRRVAARTAGMDKDETTSPAPEAAQDLQVAAVTSEAPQAPQPTPDAPSVPSVAPRPASLPVDVPAERGRGEGNVGVGRGSDGTGIGIGDIIGVVIRGGGVGPITAHHLRSTAPRADRHTTAVGIDH